MASALDWVLSVAKNLVQKPDDVQARWAEAERTVELRVAPEDRGKIIGRRGKSIDSLRIVANAAFGGGDDARIDIKLLEE
ncbi:MAG TPA: KH domain-containing protein [Elusimicrobiota bacterium]|nr:KH domain-containing protein [Elusimicrobiota bacterium]